MENYQYVKFLGQGSYGEVELVKHVLEEKEYVLKKIGLRNASIKERFAAEQEAALLAQLKHINIVSYKHSFQLDGTLHIIMQYCEGGDLHTWLSSRKGKYLDEAQVIVWFVQIALALQYLHGKNILHRDLKTQNIFLTHKNEIIKLGDLGIARQLTDTQDMARTVIGTPYYMSPELFSNRPYNYKSDVWSLGCVVYEMCTMKHAFRARDFSGLAYKICTGQVPPLPDQFSTELSCLVTSMLEQEPYDRPSVTEILHQRFIRTYIQLFIKRNRSNRKPNVPKSTEYKHRTRSTGDSDDAQQVSCRSTTTTRNVPPPTRPTSTKPEDHCPHIRVQRQVRRGKAEESVEVKPTAGKRLSNSNHLALVPSVVDLLKDDKKIEDKNGQCFVRGESKRSSSKENRKYSDPEPPSQMSSARKRRIEDKRNKSRSASAERCSPSFDLFSSHSSSSGSPSPTLDRNLKCNDDVTKPPRYPSTNRTKAPLVQSASAPTPRAGSPRPDSPVPHSPKVKSKEHRSIPRPLPPTPPSARGYRLKHSKTEDDTKLLVELMNETLSTHDTSDDSRTPDATRHYDQPHMTRLKDRLERLRNQVLPRVSREILEKAYRVLDESDPDKVQGELVLLVGPGLSSKVMEMYICENRLKSNRTLFQSI